MAVWLISLRSLRFLLIGSVKLIKSASKLIEHCQVRPAEVSQSVDNVAKPHCAFKIGLVLGFRFLEEMVSGFAGGVSAVQGGGKWRVIAKQSC